MLLLASFTCLDACCCHGLRLPVFNKETTYYLHQSIISDRSNSDTLVLQSFVTVSYLISAHERLVVSMTATARLNIYLAFDEKTR